MPPLDYVNGDCWQEICRQLEEMKREHITVLIFETNIAKIRQAQGAVQAIDKILSLPEREVELAEMEKTHYQDAGGFLVE